MQLMRYAGEALGRLSATDNRRLGIGQGMRWRAAAIATRQAAAARARRSRLARQGSAHYDTHLCHPAIRAGSLPLAPSCASSICGQARSAAHSGIAACWSDPWPITVAVELRQARHAQTCKMVSHGGSQPRHFVLGQLVELTSQSCRPYKLPQSPPRCGRNSHGVCLHRCSPFSLPITRTSTQACAQAAAARSPAAAAAAASRRCRR